MPNYALKRFIDLTLGLTMLLVASPLFVLAFALAVIDGHGNPFFLQRRLGLHCKEFTIYKFRTMNTPPEDAPAVDIKPDSPHLTPIGRFMRQTGLDELPQLLNVIKGDMSLVGPRPYALKHGERYASLP